MKQLLTKEDVSKAMADLAQQGKRPTLAAIHAALNHRGSMSTLVRLKSDLQAAAQSPNDSPEGLKAFRQTWTLAVAEGRKQMEIVATELRESLNAIAAENERLEGQVVAAQNRVRELDEVRARAESDLRDLQAQIHAELHQARAAVAGANAKAAEALECLAESHKTHANQIAALQTERDDAVRKAHEMELQFVRAQALLEAARTADRSQVQHNVAG